MPPSFRLFAKISRRRLGIILIAAAVFEAFALHLFRKIPFDVEPLIPPGHLERWAQAGVIIMHLPALPILLTPLTNYRPLVEIIVFLIGYVDTLLITFAVVVAYRVLRRVAARCMPMPNGM